MKLQELKQIIKEEISKSLNENDPGSRPRQELHRILKGLAITSKSSSYNAAERYAEFEQELEDFMMNHSEHPEFTPEKVEKILDNIRSTLREVDAPPPIEIPSKEGIEMAKMALKNTDESVLDAIALLFGGSTGIRTNDDINTKRKMLRRAMDSVSPYEYKSLFLSRFEIVGSDDDSKIVKKAGGKSDVALKESLAKDIAMYITDDEELLDKFTGNFFKDDLKKEIEKYAKANNIKVGNIATLQDEINQILNNMNKKKAPMDVAKTLSAGFNKKMNEAMVYNDYEEAQNKAIEKSKKGVAYHVVEKANGTYVVTNQYDEENTILSYLNGGPITESKPTMKKSELKDIIKEEIKKILNLSK